MRVNEWPRLSAVQSEQEPAGEVQELIRFLQGAGPLDGVWFGDPHPTEKGAFWWRKRLATLSAVQALPDYLRGYKDGLSHAAFYVRDHCQQGEEHAETVLNLKMPPPPTKEPK